MIKITEKTIKLFKEILGVDISNVMMFFQDLDNNLGEYRHGNNNMIFIDRVKLDDYPKTYRYMTIAHELMHLCQWEYNKTLCLDFSNGKTADDYDYWDEDWCDLPVEIDARIMELYYLYYINVPDHLIVSMGKWRFQNNNGIDLIPYINNLKLDTKFIAIMKMIVDELIAIKEVAVGLDK